LRWDLFDIFHRVFEDRLERIICRREVLTERLTQQLPIRGWKVFAHPARTFRRISRPTDMCPPSDTSISGANARVLMRMLDVLAPMTTTSWREEGGEG
jgi:hypothetical protein